MNFSLWAIKKPIPAILFFVVLTILGALSFKSISIQDMPDIDLPTVVVSVGLPGANATQIEKEVTRKIEDSVASLGKIKHIYSTVTEGVSSTSIEFELEKDSQEAVNDVKDAVSSVRGDLPSDITEPQVAKIKATSRPLLTYAVYSDSLNEEEISWFIDDEVSKKLLSVKDVAGISRQGGLVKNVKVELVPEKLDLYGVTAQQVYQQLKSYIGQTPSGSLDSSKSQNITTYSTVSSLEELKNISIFLNNKKIVLKDIAYIGFNVEKTYQKAFLDGKQVVAFQITRNTGASDVSVANDIREKVKELQSTNSSVQIKEIFNNVDRVKSNYKGSMSALYEGAILAVIVVWIFLKDWRATFVSAVALPLSIIPTFWIMQQFFGLSLNGLTLLAITLVVGILVDDAIVEIENISRHISMGKSPYNAAIEAADEIGLAVIATTFTLIAVFLPTAFMGGISGKFFKHFGITASIAVFMSLLVARLLTPLMAAYIMKPGSNHENNSIQKEKGFYSLYYRSVLWTVNNKIKTLAIGIAFFLISLLLIARIPTEFIPSADVSQITLSIEKSPGTTLGDITETERDMRYILSKHKEISSIYSVVGNSNEARKITAVITLVPEKERAKPQKEIESLVTSELSRLPGIKLSLGAGRSGEKYSVTLSSSNDVALNKVADEFISELKLISGLGAINSSANLKKPELKITTKQDVALAYGVSPQAIGQTLKIALSGDRDSFLSKLDWNGRRIPIRVLVSENYTQDIDNIKSLKIPSNSGLVSLGTVADVQYSSTTSVISKYDRLQNVTISVDLNGKKLSEVSDLIQNKSKVLKNLPKDVKLSPSGDAERMKELFSNFGGAMLAGIVCVYLVLVLLFHNVWQPFTILMALPLSFAGAFGLLYLFSYSMSLPVLIGLLMLMGIVTKNSILLVEYAITEKDNGLDSIAAILSACSKRSRPIIMTTAAMICGMVPLALGWDGDPSFKAPMAVAVIGGLLTSTVLSLLVIPAVYVLVENVISRFKKN